MTKPRSDSKLLNLPEEQTAQLCEWLLSGIPYHKAKELIQKEFGITTSFAALSVFYNKIVSAELTTRRRQAVSISDIIAKDAAAAPGQFDAATLDAIKQKAFEISISPQSAPGEVKALFTLLLKAKDQELKNKDIEIKLRRLVIIEKNAAEAKEKLTAVATKGGLSKEAIDEIEAAAKLL